MENLFYSDYLNRRKNRGWVINLVFSSVALLYVLFFIFNLTTSVCSVDGRSMANTLADSETVLLEKKPTNISRGQIVTIAGLSESLIIKRVMALGGDKLVFKFNLDTNSVELYRDIGEGYVLLDESGYIREPMSIKGWDEERRLFKDEYELAPPETEFNEFYRYEIEILDGECFVMGDNRNDSSDSRKYGAGKIEDIRGRMFYKVRKNSLLEKLLLLIYREK